MVGRLVIALLLGGLIGLERELVGKDAGIRTAMMVAGGAAMFTITALSLPYIISLSPDGVAGIIERNSGFLSIIANIVVGIGFLGAGTIIKTEDRVHGLTTAAVIWVAAAVGTLAGLGLLQFAAGSAIITTAVLYALRNFTLNSEPPRRKR